MAREPKLKIRQALDLVEEVANITCSECSNVTIEGETLCIYCQGYYEGEGAFDDEPFLLDSLEDDDNFPQDPNEGYYQDEDDYEGDYYDPFPLTLVGYR